MIKTAPTVIPGQLLNASPMERRALLWELLEFVESVPVSAREEHRALSARSTVGQLVVTHSNTLVMYYDRCEKDLQRRIAGCCDVASYELLKQDDGDFINVV